MANLDALKAELTNDPLQRGYAAMNDAARLASLTTADRPVYIPRVIDSDYLVNLFGAFRAAEMMEAMSQASVTSPLIKWALDEIRHRGGMSSDANGLSDVIDELEDDGILNVDPQEEINEVAVFNASLLTYVSRVTELNIGEVHLGDVAACRQG